MRVTIEAAEVELGGKLTDWRVSQESSDQVVLQAWRGPRFGTFAGSYESARDAIQTVCYGTRTAKPDVEEREEEPVPPPVTEDQAEAVAKALDDWLDRAEREDRDPILQRDQVRAFRASLAHRHFLRERPARLDR